MNTTQASMAAESPSRIWTCRAEGVGSKYMTGFSPTLPRWAKAILSIALGICFCKDTLAQIPCRYEVSNIIQGPVCPFTGPAGAFGADISPNGRFVCGYWVDCEFGFHAFLYDTHFQQFTTLPYPAGVVSMIAAGVNDNAIVVGQLEHDPSDQYWGFVWNSLTGQYTFLLPHASGAWAGANAINNSNVVCGFRSIGSQGDPVNPYEAYIWSNERFTDLGLVDGNSTVAVDINDHGESVVNVGQSIDPGAEGFLWSASELLPLGFVNGGFSSGTSAINNHHIIVGGGIVQMNPPLTAGFVFHGGVWSPLAILQTHAVAGGTDIGDSGVIVGQSRSSGSPGAWRACVWRDKLPSDLNEVTSGIPSGNVLERAVAISGTHRIAVNSRLPEKVLVLVPVFSIAGDTTCDGLVNVDDLINIITHWGPCSGCSPDLNGDQTTNIEDLQAVIANWTILSR